MSLSFWRIYFKDGIQTTARKSILELLDEQFKIFTRYQIRIVFLKWQLVVLLRAVYYITFYVARNGVQWHEKWYAHSNGFSNLKHIETNKQTNKNKNKNKKQKQKQKTKNKKQN